MKTELIKLEVARIADPTNFRTLSFIRGTTQFTSSGKQTAQGLVYECDFRFVLSSKNDISASILQCASIFRLTFEERVVLIGSMIAPCRAIIESYSPTVFRVKHSALMPYE